MKIITLLPFAVAAAEDLPPVGPQLYCYNSCLTVDSCNKDPHAHSTYCKYWLSTPVCFGLYWKSENKTDMCFQPGDTGCPETWPVTCVDGPATTVPPRESVVPRTTNEPMNTTEPTGTETTTTMAEPSGTDSTDAAATTTTQPMSSETSETTTIPSESTLLVTFGPSGDYCGTVESTVTLGIHMTFHDSTMDFELSEYIQGSISGVPFTYNESTKLVQIQPTGEYQTFLSQLPLVLAPEDIVVTYDPSADRVSGTVLGISIPATKGAC